MIEKPTVAASGEPFPIPEQFETSEAKRLAQAIYTEAVRAVNDCVSTSRTLELTIDSGVNFTQTLNPDEATLLKEYKKQVFGFYLHRMKEEGHY